MAAADVGCGRKRAVTARLIKSSARFASSNQRSASTSKRGVPEDLFARCADLSGSATLFPWRSCMDIAFCRSRPCMKMKLGSIEALRQAKQASSSATIVANSYGTLNSTDMTRAQPNVDAGHSHS
ncbi:MAG: hypothetical protein ABWY92_19615 [Xanthobacteraceae bacterium]